MPNENSKEMDDILVLAAGGNEDALLCLRLAVTFFHKSDDFIDLDTALTVRTLTDYNNSLVRLLGCEFYLQYKPVLTICLVLMGDDYAVAEEDSRWAVLRHCGNNFVRTVALLTGGEPLMVKVGKLLRDISYKEQIQIQKVNY